MNACKQQEGISASTLQAACQHGYILALASWLPPCRRSVNREGVMFCMSTSAHPAPHLEVCLESHGLDEVGALQVGTLQRASVGARHEG